MRAFTIPLLAPAAKASRGNSGSTRLTGVRSPESADAAIEKSAKAKAPLARANRFAALCMVVDPPFYVTWMRAAVY
ncbi:MAG: hypothetical protein ABI789_15545 [Usitatibacter sp.]